MEDDLHFFENGVLPQINCQKQIKNDLKIFNGRRPKYFCEWETTSNSFKWKTTSTFLKNEDDLKKNDAT